MKVTEDMKADRDWLVQTLNRTAGGSLDDQKVAWADLKEAGWADVFGRISGTWTQFDDSGRPTNRIPLRACSSLLQACGVFKAGLVLSALDLWIASPDGQRQPSPADLYHVIANPRANEGAVNQPQDPRRDQQPEVLSLVADWIARGEPVCECKVAPPNLVQDDRGVLYCPDCAGIERGQADQADEHVNPAEPDDLVPIHDLSAVLRLKKMRSIRASKAIEGRL